MSNETIWKNYWCFILKIGLSMGDFWIMTPRELCSLIDNKSEHLRKKDLSELINLFDKYNV